MSTDKVSTATLDSALQYERGAEVGFNIDASTYFKKWVPEKIVFAGMGGSAIVGGLTVDWLKTWCRIPVSLCRSYYPPAYVDEDTLTIAISYSGETEEALTFAYRAYRRGAKVVGVSSGGFLEEMCHILDLPHIKVPGGYQPRAALGSMLSSTLAFLESNVVRSGRLERELEETVNVLSKLRSRFDPSVTVEDGNLPKHIAEKIYGKTPIIYGWEPIPSVAFRWKTQFNENSKIYAIESIIPEMHHNEIVAYQENGFLPSGLITVFLRSKLEPEEIRGRIEVTRRLLEERGVELLEVWGEGETMLANIASIVYIGDLASLYLAHLRGVNPADISIIGKLKSEIDRKMKIKEKLKEELGLT